MSGGERSWPARRGSSATNVGPAKRAASIAIGLGILGVALALRSKRALAVGAALGAAHEVFRGATGYCFACALLGIRRAHEDGKGAGMNVGEVPIHEGRPSGGEHATGGDGQEQPSQRSQRSRVGIASEDSFPASDPPGWIGN